jgi:hypothetical protein
MHITAGRPVRTTIPVPSMQGEVLASLPHLALRHEAFLPDVLDAPVGMDDTDAHQTGAVTHETL